jgi:hypothetical protein
MDSDDLDGLARALVGVGRAVRDAVRATRSTSDEAVVRTEGGDDVFGVDERAEQVLLAGMAAVGEHWPGEMVLEGFDDRVPVGPRPGRWVHLADPVDGTRPYLADLRSAWVLLGAGRHAATLEDLEVGAAIEIPTTRAALGRVVWAVKGGRAHAVDDDLCGRGLDPMPLELQPRSGADPTRTFLTVVRLLPGDHGPIGDWADAVLEGWEVYDDLVPCTGGHLHSVASGAASAVLDPRPLLRPGSFPTHPYDLAALVAMRATGMVVEALPPGPLDVPLDPDAPVAWAAYANEDLARAVRARMARTAPEANE